MHIPIFIIYCIVIFIELIATVLIIVKKKNNLLKCFTTLGITYVVLMAIGMILHLRVIIEILPTLIVAFGEPILLISSIGFSILIYIIPTIVAYNKKHTNRLGIFLLNIFFGWTILGWIGALIWACILGNGSKDNINNNKYEDLEKLQKLKESGAITDVEFEQEKQKLLK